MTQEAFKLFANEIKAFQEGKQIQVLIRNKWVDTDNPSFDVKSKYRVKPEEPKTILERSIDGVIWYEIGKVPTELNNKMKFARIRIIGEEKPKTTKRLPTIEEVEKWFMENRVFVYKKTGTYERIATFNSTRYTPICNFDKEWLTIEEFCQLYSNIDGSELYITENEKNIYRSVDNAKGDDSICSIIYAIKEKIPYGGEIADFPIEVVERMLECQVEQGNKRDVSVFERNKMAGNYGFVWERTKEGLFFWQEVIVCKDFDLFFEKYPKKSNQ